MWKSTIYWFGVGACTGLGIIMIFSLGIALLLAALALVLYATRQGLGKNMWAAMLGLGLAPALLLTYEYASTSASSFLSGYTAVIIACWAIALIGLLWGLSGLLLHRRAS